jgi:hypothetical protein
MTLLGRLARLTGRRSLIPSVVIVLASACSTIDDTVGIPPFWEEYPTPSSIGTSKGTETLFRPFVSVENADPEGERVRLFPPVFDFRSGPEEDRYWVLPIFLYRDFAQPQGGRDVDWMLFPLIFAGDDPEEGSYFAVLPFGGTLKGLLALDRVDFVLFPAYWHSVRENRHSLHVVWPFYNEVWGVDWSGWRLWPFWGRYVSHTEEGILRYDREFIMWPFYVHHDDQMNIEPTSLFFTFPFYGERINRRSDTRTYLWPFFQVHRDLKYDRTMYMGYIFPFRIAEGQTDIWPFFGVKHSGHGTEIRGVAHRRYRQYCLWPIQRYQWSTDGIEEATHLWVLPLFWHSYYIDKNALRSRVDTKVWPFFRWRRSGDLVAFDLLSPLWFKRDFYDRYYGRWFEIFRYRERKHVGGWEVLWGAVMYRWRTERREQVFSILGGLFECGARDGDTVLRLLWFPWW